MAARQPEEDAAQWRRRSGIERVEGVPRDTHLRPDPSLGGARGYDIILCRMLMADYLAGRPVIRSMVRSIQRWLNRTLPHPGPLASTGLGGAGSSMQTNLAFTSTPPIESTGHHQKA